MLATTLAGRNEHVAADRLAHELFVVAFSQRESVADEARRRAYSAGVGLAALHDEVTVKLGYEPLAELEYDDIEMLLADVSAQARDLRPPVVDCLTDPTGATTEGTKGGQIDESLRHRETTAFETLSTLAME